MAGGWSVTERIRASLEEKAKGIIRPILDETAKAMEVAYNNAEYDGPLNIHVEIKDTKAGYSIWAHGKGVYMIEYGAGDYADGPNGSYGEQILYRNDNGKAFWYFQPADWSYRRTGAGELKKRPERWTVFDDDGITRLDAEGISRKHEEYNLINPKKQVTRAEYIHTFGHQGGYDEYGYTGEYDDNWTYTEGNEAHYIMQSAIEEIKDRLRR